MSAPASNRTLGELADEHGRTERLNDPAPTFEPVCEDTDTKGNSTCLTLQSCPSCPVKFDTERDLRLHLELHDPDHYRLAALGEGRKRSTEEIFAGQEKPPALKEPEPLHWKRGEK